MASKDEYEDLQKVPKSDLNNILKSDEFIKLTSSEKQYLRMGYTYD